jgi:polyphosphate kinase
MNNKKFFIRDLSWLSFNYRVLQEAKDPSVPLYEKIKFIAIFSSNLDEFFRVRVASIKSLLNLKNKTQRKLQFDPVVLLERIAKTVYNHQEEYGKIWREIILPQLNQNNIFLLKDNDLTGEQKELLREDFNQNILPYLRPMILIKKKVVPFLQNSSLYLAVRLSQTKSDSIKNKVKTSYGLVEVPTQNAKRFIILQDNDKHCIMFIDDLIRIFLPEVFPGYKVEAAYEIKLTRDAELYIDDEFSGNLLEKIKKGLGKRKTGPPARFLFDKDMPKDMIKFLRDNFEIRKEELVPGGRYHNMNDLFGLPLPKNAKLENEPQPPVYKKELEGHPFLFESIKESDHLLTYPYQKFDYVIRFLNEAANDPAVQAIKITLYRTAKNSGVMKELINAAKNNKDVTAFVECKARFDEESNIHWAEELAANGVKVLYSFPGIKVHCKLCLVYRKEDEQIKKYAYLATGNFNESTAKIYSDNGMFTADKRLTDDAEKVFEHLTTQTKELEFDHLLVAQFNLREKLYELIDNEIANAKAGKKARIILKVNHIEERKMIVKLYEASCAGVKIQMVVRGICCLIPGVKDLSENIKITSIVDRYLEHSRVFIFHHNGKEKFYLGSADLMVRNLSRRIEVAFPVYDKKIQEEIKKIISIQLGDNVKARVINKAQNNNYKKAKTEETVRAQTAIYELLKPKADEND